MFLEVVAGHPEETLVPLVRTALFVGLLLALPVLAAEPFDGVWKMQPGSPGI